MLYPIEIKTPNNLINEPDFLKLCVSNKEINFERNADKSIVIMAPTFSGTGRFNAKLITQFENWNSKNSDNVYVFESSSGFTLPNGAVRSPDLSWILKSRYERFLIMEDSEFVNVCPDFVLEHKSKSDSILQLKNKMNEYMDNGCRLGFLIDPEYRQVYVYHNGEEIIKAFSDEISGFDVLPGFFLDLTIFD